MVRKRHSDDYILKLLREIEVKLSMAFPQRSPPSLFTTAACGGLGSVPDDRTRRALLHLSHSYAPQFLCDTRDTRPKADIEHMELAGIYFPRSKVPTTGGWLEPSRNPVFMVAWGLLLRNAIEDGRRAPPPNRKGFMIDNPFPMPVRYDVLWVGGAPPKTNGNA